MNYKIINKDCLIALDELNENSIDCIITDPPYELNFMNKGWDNAGVSFNKETWSKCLRVLKEGGYLLAFGGTRTYHRIACAIEDAGFEIRDSIMWLYGSGFPKSMNIGKKLPEWQGWGTALKPAYEPIIVARKRFKGSLADNVLKNGVGGINIDECRVKTQDDLYRKPCENGSIFSQQEKKYTTGTMNDSYKLGRFPANVILTYDETDKDEVCGKLPYTKSQKRSSKYNKETVYTNTYTPVKSDYRDDNTYSDNGSASRYFYCAKASKKDRDEGLDEFEEKTAGERTNRKEGSAGINAYAGATGKARNFHPTVKPTELMQYLVRLVAPKNATILDCFMGSGSTGKAVAYENKERNMNYQFIGIELDPEYCKIAKARIEHAIIDYRSDSLPA